MSVGVATFSRSIVSSRLKNRMVSVSAATLCLERCPDGMEKERERGERGEREKEREGREGEEQL